MCIHQCLMAIKSRVQQFIFGRYLVSLQLLHGFTCRECFKLFFVIKKEWTCCIWRTKFVKVKVSKKLWRPRISSQTVLQIMFYFRLFEIKKCYRFWILISHLIFELNKSRTRIEDKKYAVLITTLYIMHNYLFLQSSSQINSIHLEWRYFILIFINLYVHVYDL